jgi:hypothetical protein
VLPVRLGRYYSLREDVAVNEVPTASGGSDPADLRRRALIAFLAAGMAPAPATAQLVSALANARRAVAANLSQGLPVGEWLQSEIRFRGIRENAAMLAALEIPEMREPVATRFRQEHPERENLLDEILAYL